MPPTTYALLVGIDAYPAPVNPLSCGFPQSSPMIRNQCQGSQLMSDPTTGPVVFIAFANDRQQDGAHLRNLAQEV